MPGGLGAPPGFHQDSSVLLPPMRSTGGPPPYAARLRKSWTETGLVPRFGMPVTGRVHVYSVENPRNEWGTVKPILPSELARRRAPGRPAGEAAAAGPASVAAVAVAAARSASVRRTTARR